MVFQVSYAMMIDDDDINNYAEEDDEKGLFFIMLCFIKRKCKLDGCV